jgi:hypothetical protein
VTSLNELDAVFPTDVNDASHIRATWLGELIGAAGKEPFKTGWRGEYPMAAGGRTDIAIVVRAALRKVNNASRRDLYPVSRHIITDASFDYQEQFILIGMDVEGWAAARRRLVKHHAERPTGLLATKHDRVNLAKGA